MDLSFKELSFSNSVDLHGLILEEIQNRYQVDNIIASEMAWDFLELVTALDSNVETLEKYFFNK